MSRPSSAAARARDSAMLLLLVTGCAGARATPAPSPGMAPAGDAASPPPHALPDSTEYSRLVARLVAGDTLVNYGTLRLAYAATSAYDPYEFDREGRNAMFEALDRGEAAAARAIADSALATNFTDVFAHIGRGTALDRLGDGAGAALHFAVARGLIESIEAGGGRTAESPMIVISIDEEYALIRSRGLQRRMQALGECGGRMCDHMEVVDLRTGEEFTLYFDVSIPYEWFGRRIGRDALQ